MAKRQPDDVVTVSVDALKLDPQNRRQRTDRGRAMLKDSIKEVGVGRSIVIDEQNQILAGEGTLEAAVASGIKKVRIVDTDGDELIAHRRRNLTAEQKRKLGLYDNRTSDLSEWNLDQLQADADGGLSLEPFFDASELAELLDRPDADQRPATVEEVSTTPVADTFWISIRGPLAQQAFALKRLQALMKDLADVDVELGTIAADLIDEG